MARKMIECDEGCWSSGSEVDDECVERNYCYMATCEPPGRSIIQYVKFMIIDNNFDLSVCEPYLTQIQSYITVIHKAYDSAT